jgi:hypothetical protein
MGLLSLASTAKSDLLAGRTNQTLFSSSRSNISMKLSRLAGLVFLVALAINLVAVTAASAAEPEFKPGTLNRFTGESGAGALEAAGTAAVTCTSDTSVGEITGPKTIGSVVVIFHGCSSTEKGGCTVKSTHSTPGLIVTNTLKGELGTTKEAKSGVGLLLSPETGTEFVSLEGECLVASPAPVNGTVAGEVTPVSNGETTDGKLVFIGNAGNQTIKAIASLGIVKKPELKALGLLKSSETTTELVLYSSVVEVT